MAKTKPQAYRHHRSKKPTQTASGPRKLDSVPPDMLLAQASALLQTGEPDRALTHAAKALQILQPTSAPTLVSLPALSLLGEISIERGDVAAATLYFGAAAQADPRGDAAEERGGGAEKFFWLAQLCEEGGRQSVAWYEKGADCLRRQIADLDGQPQKLAGRAERERLVREKREKLAQALCGIAEVYMTDLSFDDVEAERHCDKVMVEALLVAPDNPEVLQTIASVRISQSKMDEARQYLERSLQLWSDLPPEDGRVPGFPSRISLSRLLMDAEMETAAARVLERLVQEDDASVEAWYLGGWCLHLMAEKASNGPAGTSNGNSPDAERVEMLRNSRSWLEECTRLYAVQGYEDEPLASHARELIQELNSALGPATDESPSDDASERSGWTDADDESVGADEEMDLA